MTPTPTDLKEFRDRTRRSYGPRIEGRLIAPADYERMTSAERNKARWTCAPALVAELIRAERVATGPACADGAQ